MAYDYDKRYHVPRRHDSHYSTSRDTDAYSRYATNEPTAMYNNLSQGGYAPTSSYSSYDARYAARATPPLPKRSSAYTSTRSSTRNTRRWPPSPSVEDEKASLSKEVLSSAGSDVEDRDGGEAKSRGSVDQYPIIEEIERPRYYTEISDERRFVLVSDPNDDAEAQASAARERRRKSFAERGNMAHLDTDIDDEPLLPKRTSTPYAYTKPQKESLAPSAADYFLSPEPITPNSSSTPRSVPKHDGWDPKRDQNSRPPRSVPSPVHSRYDSFTQSPRAPKNDVFDDSDTDDFTHLRTERKPARYSFVKSDLQKEHLRTNLLDSQAKSEKKRPEHHRTNSRGTHNNSSGSSKNASPGSQSPRSSTSSLNNNSSSRPIPRSSTLDSEFARNSNKYPDGRHSRPSSPFRPSSPLPNEPPRSPKLPPRRPTESPPTSRPSSRSGPVRPASPLSSSTTYTSSRQAPITDADWHATYPPVNTNDRSREPRFNRHETMPVPMPTIGVQSPSPARPPKAGNPLPYPVDDRLADVFMPPEERYQFDHTYSAPSPKPSLKAQFPDSPNIVQSPVPGSPRAERPSSSYLRSNPTSGRHSPAPDDKPRSPRVRSNSVRSQASLDGRRAERRPPSIDRPMPSCPRSEPSSKYEDWYTLENCPNFDICPSCYNGVFADTAFSDYFKPVRRYDERFCDFSSPWMRLAWLLTIKQQRKSPDLIYNLATIADVEFPCPKERNVPGMTWYGIQDLRDGIHISNFAICPCDVKMLEALCPTVRGYLTRLPTSQYGISSQNHTCSLRTSSKRFPKYLDLLVELDEEARQRGQHPDMARFIKLAREHAFKAECFRDKPFVRRPWHFIPALPELTVCEECYDTLIYPAIQSKNSIAKLFNRSTQLVPGEDAETGTSCCLYSPRMKRVWSRVLEDEDWSYLKRKAIERKRVEGRLGREKADLRKWVEEGERRGYSEREVERLRRDLLACEEEWRTWE